MNKETTRDGKQRKRPPAATAARGEPDRAGGASEYHRAWALRWDGGALAAARGKMKRMTRTGA